jgi:hypothetical protein
MNFSGILSGILKFLAYLAAGIGLIFFLFLAPGIWRHIVTYPRLDRQVAEYGNLRQEPENISGLNTYRGVMHVHSYWSHDSEG